MQTAKQLTDFRVAPVKILRGIGRVRLHPRIWTHPGIRLSERRRNEPIGIHVWVDPQLRAGAVGQPLELDRSHAMLERGRDGRALPQTAIEADREDPCHVSVGRCSEPDDALDMRQQRSGLGLAVTGAEHDQLDRRTRCAERFCNRVGRDELCTAVLCVEEQAVRTAVPAEMDHRRLDLAQRPEQIERLRGPSRLELEMLSVAAAPQFYLDRTRLLVERELISAVGVGGQKQDRLPPHEHPASANRLAGQGVAWFCDTPTRSHSTITSVIPDGGGTQVHRGPPRRSACDEMIWMRRRSIRFATPGHRPRLAIRTTGPICCSLR